MKRKKAVNVARGVVGDILDRMSFFGVDVCDGASFMLGYSHALDMVDALADERLHGDDIADLTALALKKSEEADPRFDGSYAKAVPKLSDAVGEAWSRHVDEDDVDDRVMTFLSGYSFGVKAVPMVASGQSKADPQDILDAAKRAADRHTRLRDVIRLAKKIGIEDE